MTMKLTTGKRIAETSSKGNQEKWREGGRWYKLDLFGYEAFLREARRQGHDLLRLNYYDGDTLCTKICADKVTRCLAVDNLVDDPLSTAFGVNTSPTWEDLEDFLEERCVPSQRDGLQYYLRELGLDHYDPLAIVRKTQGRMAEDNCWLDIVEGGAWP